MYKILEGDRVSLEAQVNELLRDGWHLHGNGYFANHVHYQPMSKGGEMTAETLGEPLRPVENTHTIVLDASDLNKSLDNFLTKFAAVAGDTPAKEKGKREIVDTSTTIKKS